MDTSTKDILFLCQFFFPEYNSSATLPYDTAKYLAANNFMVGALVGYPKEYSKLKRVKKKEDLDGIRIRRVKYLQLSRVNKIGRLINYFSFTISALLHIRILKKYESVIVYSNPPVLPIIPLIAKKRYGTKIVFVAYDVYPEVAYASNSLAKGSLIDKAMGKINQNLYKNADVVVCLTDEMQDFLIQHRSGLDRSRTKTIPNWAHEKKAKKESNAYKQFGYKENQFIISYFGNMGTCQDVDTMMEAARLLKEDDRFCFLIIGHGNKQELVKKTIANAGLQNVKVYDFLTGNPFEQAVAISSCCIVSLENGLIGTCAPSKYYSYLQGGKPILAVVEERSYIKKEIEEEKIGYSVRVGDGEGLKNAIIRMFEEPDEMKKMGERARQLYEKNYAYEISMIKYKNLFSQIINMNKEQTENKRKDLLL